MAAVLALAVVAARAVNVDKYVGAGESGIPTAHSCELKMVPMGPEGFVSKALGGDVGCVVAEDKTECCKEVSRGVGRERQQFLLCFIFMTRL